MAEEKLTAATRLEKILDNIAGGDNEITPATRLEKFLSYIADAVEGGGNINTDLYIATTRANVTISATSTQAVPFAFVQQDQTYRYVSLQNYQNYGVSIVGFDLTTLRNLDLKFLGIRLDQDGIIIANNTNTDIKITQSMYVYLTSRISLPDVTV